MKPRIVLPRRADRRISFLYGPPFPGEAGWVWTDRRAHLERRSRHSGIERRARQREEAFFRTLFELAPEAAVVLDCRGAVVAANRGCELLSGFRREELLGQAVETLLPERHCAAYTGECERYAAQPRLLRLETEIRRRDGSEVAVVVSLCPVETLQRQVAFALVRDISEERRLLAALRREIAALEAARASLEADLRAVLARRGG